jgi:hypothetical protein
MTRDEWITAFATAAGTTAPGADDIEALLELAATAAHASERTAAPVACWIAASAGLSPRDAAALASSIAADGD